MDKQAEESFLRAVQKKVKGKIQKIHGLKTELKEHLVERDRLFKKLGAIEHKANIDVRTFAKTEANF